MKKEKGMHGYLNQKKKSLTLYVIINLIGVFAFYLLGKALEAPMSTYVTITAVLLVVPLGFFMTGLITLRPWFSISTEQMEEFSAVTGDWQTSVTSYDLVLTVKEKQLYAGAVLFSSRELVVYTDGKNMNLQQRRNELSEMLRGTGYFTGVYMTDNWDSFMSRVKANVKADIGLSNKDELYKQKERLLIYSV
ncbi:MAG: hypothetical protein IIX65_08415 [Lachnospiraceae bacterium]|nr:hypothetical protein [Lachnospiraceae bacterium]